MTADFDRTDTSLEGAARNPAARRLVPMTVGSATLYVEATDGRAELPPGDDFHAVGVSPQKAFETASDALKECVRVVGERITDLADTMRPEEVTVEFTITFDVEGEAKIIPVLLTGKAKTAVGVKVAAKWCPGA